MASALTGTQIKNSYLDICQFGNSGSGIAGVLKSVCDGAGNTTPLQLSNAAITTTVVPSLPTQSANIVFAGPNTGSAAVPTFRAIVVADLPTITGAIGGTGVNNGTATITVANNVTFAGNFAVTITSSNTTNATLPAGTHTLAGLDVAQNWTANQTFTAVNIITDTTVGMKIGTQTSQKLGFFNATPVAQQTGNLITALGNLGLVASGTLTSTNVGLGSVENTALSTWAGTTNIITLGTVTTGTWSAGTIALNKGGTGATTQAGAANAVLPSQGGNNTKFLQTDGSNVSWQTAGGGGGVTSLAATSGGGLTVSAATGAVSIAMDAADLGTGLFSGGTPSGRISLNFNGSTIYIPYFTSDPF